MEIIIGVVCYTIGVFVGMYIMKVLYKYFDKLQKDREEKVRHYACTNCGESIEFSTQTPVEYCPFCGEEYEGVEK